jgi:hypothetical protein
MGVKIFEQLEKHMPSNTTGVFVEIGSDRYEGSTAFLANLAKRHGTKLISVDITLDAKNRIGQQFDNVEFVIQTGSEWAQEFAYSNTDVAVVYLDNFDYIYDVKEIHSHTIIKKQIADYAKKNIIMNNVNCQVEHMKQLLALQKLFHPDTVIIFDDTYQLNNCWVGKCGPCVTYLLCQGYEILEWTSDCGMIMKRKP